MQLCCGIPFTWRPRSRRCVQTGSPCRLQMSHASPPWCINTSTFKGGTPLRCPRRWPEANCAPCALPTKPVRRKSGEGVARNFLFICGVQEYVESMARTPRSSIRQGSFTPHILGCPQHRKSDAKYPFERKLRPKTPFLREYALFSSRSWARNMRSILPLKSFHFKLLVV